MISKYMRFIAKLVFSLLLLVPLVVPFVKPTYAATYTLSGKVADSSNNAIQGANVFVLNSDTNNVITSATTDSSGNYSLSVEQGTYKIEVVPPESSGFQTSVQTNQNIFVDTTLNFVLVPGQTMVTITGHIYDKNQQPLSGLTVSSGYTQTVTDNTGYYSVSTPPGNNLLRVFDYPSHFRLYINYNPTADTTVDVTIPTNTLTVQVQDSNNNAFPNANVIVAPVDGSTTTLSIPTSIGVMSAYAQADGGNYFSGNTDSNGTISGTVISGGEYNIHVNPESNDYLSVSSNVTVSGDQTVPITLQGQTMVTITGHIYDKNQQPLSGLTVSSGYTQTVTDNTGYYSVSTPPGNNLLRVFDYPSHFRLYINYNPTADTTVDVTIPTNTLTVQVQDSNNNAFPNANVIVAPVDGSTTTLSIPTSIGVMSAYAQADGGNYFSGNTDSNGTISGTVISGGEYNIHVNPESNDYLSVSSNVTVSGDDIEVYSLQKANSAPVVGAITAPSNPVQVGTSINASANFTDTNTTDTHIATWTWGDGSISNATVAESNGSGSVQDTHKYTQAGVYTVTLTVTDDGGLSNSSQFQYVVVYDPSAGFITASGKYSSQAGWDLLNTQATGEVKFGIQSKYKKNNTTPDGNTKLTFKVGNIDFNSTSYQWLVVNTSKGYLMGNGTVNGKGNYTIFISVIDGSQTKGQDLIRVIIRDTSTQDVIYDTQPGQSSIADPTTPINNGSIKVH